MKHPQPISAWAIVNCLNGYIFVETVRHTRRDAIAIASSRYLLAKEKWRDVQAKGELRAIRVTIQPEQ